MTADLTVHSQEFLVDEAATLAFGARLGQSIKAPAWVHLHGDLGAGKTTFARGFLSALGQLSHVRSPTYTLIESYYLGNSVVHHLDLYRLASAVELLDLGLDDLAADPAIWLIEWPDRGTGVLPDWTHRIALSDAVGGGRDVSLTRRHT